MLPQLSNRSRALCSIVWKYEVVNYSLRLNVLSYRAKTSTRVAWIFFVTWSNTVDNSSISSGYFPAGERGNELTPPAPKMDCQAAPAPITGPEPDRASPWPHFAALGLTEQDRNKR